MTDDVPASQRRGIDDALSGMADEKQGLLKVQLLELMRSVIPVAERDEIDSEHVSLKRLVEIALEKQHLDLVDEVLKASPDDPEILGLRKAILRTIERLRRDEVLEKPPTSVELIKELLGINKLSASIMGAFAGWSALQAGLLKGAVATAGGAALQTAAVFVAIGVAIRGAMIMVDEKQRDHFSQRIQQWWKGVGTRWDTYWEENEPELRGVLGADIDDLPGADPQEELQGRPGETPDGRPFVGPDSATEELQGRPGETPDGRPFVGPDAV